MNANYLCTGCGATYELLPSVMLCPGCETMYEPGKPLRGVLKVILKDEVSRNWSPLDLFPVEEDYFPPIPVGQTPLWHPRVGHRLGFTHLYVKDETRNPTGSLKDRASYLVSAFANQHALNGIALASTGNAGSSMAGIGAAAGQSVTLFLPATVPRAKLVQAMQYGAKVILVDGNYDLAYQLSMDYCQRMGLLSRNTAFNPLTIEGKKTVSLEMVRQLRRAPDCVFVPTGDGVILAGVYKGFEDLMLLNVINHMPAIYAVQTSGSSAIARALRTGSFESKPSYTIADSLSVDVPCNGYQALEYLQKYNGRCIEVTDDEILSAQQMLSAESGLFIEPSSAAAFAAFLSEQNALDQRSTVIILATGSGLKDIDTAATRLPKLPPAVRSLANLYECRASV